MRPPSTRERRATETWLGLPKTWCLGVAKAHLCADEGIAKYGFLYPFGYYNLDIKI
jgi:hypothetical protein